MQRISESASLSIVFQQVHTFLEIIWVPQEFTWCSMCPTYHSWTLCCMALATCVHLQTKDLHPMTLCHTSLSSYVSIQMGMLTHYNVEYIIQETTCPRSTEAVTADKCPPMECEFTVSPDKLYILHWSNVYFNLQGFFFCLLKRSIVHAQFHSLHLLVFSNPTVFGLYSHRAL